MDKKVEVGIRKFRFGEIFYYLYWMIMLFAKGIGLYEGMWQYNLCILLAMFCLGCKLVLTSYRLRELVWMILAAAFGTWIYLNAKDQSAFILAATMIGLKDVPLDRVFKIGLLEWGACFVYMIVKTLLFGETGTILVHEKLGLGPILRWSLGYTHPNVLHITYVVLAAFIIYVWNRKPGRGQWKLTLALMAGNLYVFMYSISFTGFLLLTLLLFFNLYFENRKKISGIESVLLQCMLPFCIFFSLALPMLLSSEGVLFTLINKALNTRFLATRVYLAEMGLSLLGKKREIPYDFAVDCSYAEAILSYGVIAFALLMAAYMLTIRRLVHTEYRKELTIMLALLAAGVSEPFLFNASFKNITILFVGKYLFEFSGAMKAGEKSIWSREIPLLSAWNREYAIDCGQLICRFGGMKEKLRSHSRRMICAMAVVCVLSSLAAARFVWQPDSIYVEVGATDCGEREIKYLDMENLPEDFNSAVYLYQGPETAMYEFDGNILKVEYVRKVVSAGVWGALSAAAVYAVILSFAGRKRLA